MTGESPSPQKLDIERTASTSSNAPLLTPSQLSALSLASPKVNFALHAVGLIPGAVVYTGLLSGGLILLNSMGLWLKFSECTSCCCLMRGCSANAAAAHDATT